MFTDDLSLEDFEEEIGEMAHLWKTQSGLPYEVLIDYLGKYRKRVNNSPRIMIWLDEQSYDFVPISIDKDNPKVLIEKEVPDFEFISDWIKNHYVILMIHWNRLISDYKALTLLEKEQE